MPDCIGLPGISDGCINPQENKDTGLCASCGAMSRKMEKQAAKDQQKRAMHKPIAKQSDKMKKHMGKYVVEKMLFIKGQRCAVWPFLPAEIRSLSNGHPLATDIHHKRGKVGFIDSWAKERGITALMDKRHWLAVSRIAHDYITENSAWAIENGFSELRTTKE